MKTRNFVCFLALSFLVPLFGRIPAEAAETSGPVLDTLEYVSVAGDSYVFRADTDRNAAPEPYTTDPSVASVVFAGSAGTGKYLYRVTARAPGSADVGVRTPDSLRTFPFRAVSGASVPSFPPLLQKPELPTGCEVTALANVMNFYGYPVSKTYLADSMLPKDDFVSSGNGGIFRADPYRAFVGNPRGNGFGCYAPVIVQTARKYLSSAGSRLTVTDLSGSEPSALYRSVIAGTPVLVWATIGLTAPTFRSGWTVRDTGKKIQWIGGEHCMVLIGCSASTVTLSDPLRGIVTYSRPLFETRYRQVMKQAVVIR